MYITVPKGNHSADDVSDIQVSVQQCIALKVQEPTS